MSDGLSLFSSSSQRTAGDEPETAPALRPPRRGKVATVKQYHTVKLCIRGRRRGYNFFALEKCFDRHRLDRSTPLHLSFK